MEVRNSCCSSGIASFYFEGKRKACPAIVTPVSGIITHMLHHGNFHPCVMGIMTREFNKQLAEAVHDISIYV